MNRIGPFETPDGGDKFVSHDYLNVPRPRHNQKELERDNFRVRVQGQRTSTDRPHSLSLPVPSPFIEKRDRGRKKKPLQSRLQPKLERIYGVWVFDHKELLGKSTWTAHPRVVPGRQLGSARLRKTDSLGVVEQPRLLFYGRPEGIYAFLLSFLKVHCVSRPSPGA